MEVVELAHHPELSPVLARWHVAEWQHLYRRWDLDAAVAEFDAMRTPGRIPTTWVAFAGSGRTPADVLGSISLIDDDELDGFQHLRPWLASLYVVPEARGAGVGRTLVERAVGEARALGIERLQLFTSGQEAFWEALGWRPLARTTACGHPATILVLDLDPRAPRRAVTSRWCSDPDVATAYSYLRPGGTPADRDVLARPVAPGLLLAGEATWRPHPGTMHGAWFSGVRAAQAVLADADPRPVVVVVGAGLAGVAAAQRLHERGREVVVLEAADEPGGRLRTDDPPLPPTVVASLDRIGAGMVAKVFVTFDEAFWEPHRAFWTAGEPPLPFELWVDVSASVGRPALCAFAVGRAALDVEARSEDDLCRLAREVLATAGVLDRALPSTSGPT